MFEHFVLKRQLRSCAKELERRKSSAERGQDLMPEPVIGCEALGSVEGTPVLSWMYFNPMGPTACSLFFAPVPDTEDSILSFNSMNPFQKEWIAYLLMPGPLSPKAVTAAVGALFLANGHSTAPLFSGLPTSVFHAENWFLPAKKPLLSDWQARSLFRMAAQQIQDIDFPTINNYLRQYKGDPWERTAAELQEGLLQSVIRTDQPKANFEEGLFQEWFDLITDPEHVRSEQRNFQAAWQGAIENAQGKYR